MRFLLTLFLAGILYGVQSCRPQDASHAQKNNMHFMLSDKQLGAPNSLVIIDREYHLFYEEFIHNSSGKVSVWGHAKSKDLLHWQTLPTPFKRNSNESIGTGSVVVDQDNVSGFGVDDVPMLAFYTTKVIPQTSEKKEDKAVHIALSTDRGTTWEEKTEWSIALNDCPYPIKDPKVFWHAETQSWIVAVLSGYQVRFYSSADLLTWNFMSAFGDEMDEKMGQWTHVEFSQMSLENSGNKYWVLFISGDEGSPNGGAGTQYFVGVFDGFQFIPESHKPKWLDNGTDNYAGVCVTNFFEKNEPSYYLGKMGNSQNNAIGNESYTLTRKMSLTQKFNGLYIQSLPVTQTDKQENVIPGKDVTGELLLDEKFEIPLELNLTFDVNNRVYLDFPEVFGLKISNQQNENLVVGYHSLRRYFFIHQTDDSDKNINKPTHIDYAFYAMDQPVIELKVIIDTTSIEVFTANGLISMTQKIPPLKGKQLISLFAEKGKIKLLEGNYTNH